ncbi:MAG TPA: hypothetical protein VFY18_12545, partial [Candidatus Limnocylindrales bacterium]|nr:hypothetical protein [Candidatus Limnocylindrales bacterium]
MTKPRDPEALLSAYLVGGMEVLPDRVVDSVLDEIHRTRQRAVFGPWKTGSMIRTALGAAAVVAVVVSGAALLLARPSPSVIANPSPSLGVGPGPSQPAPTSTPSAAVTPPAVQSIKLNWTKVALDKPLGQVAWLGDRFVLVDEDTGEVRTSLDGANWQLPQPGDSDPGYAELLRGSFATWQDDVVGWWNPEDRGSIAGQPPVTARDILRIVRPPAAPTDTTPFKGRIESIGIGPAGIVAFVHSHLDWDAWVASKLGDDWVSRYKGVDFKDGILQITMKPGQGRGLKVVWADEGFEPGDYMDAGFGWYSPDGEQWTSIPAPAQPTNGDSGLGFPTGFGEIVGVSDGFIVRGDTPEDSCPLPDGCGSMWHSSDGLTWRNLGHPEANSSSDGSVLLPWKGGALVTDGVGLFDFWTSQGPSELPIAAELPATWKQADRFSARFATGPLGLVAVHKDDHQEILFTRDGVAWDIQAMPAEMEADHTSFYGWANAVVGDR